jgi:hypothetical protein
MAAAQVLYGQLYSVDVITAYIREDCFVDRKTVSIVKSY